MFFLLSKTFGFLILPSNAIATLGGIGLLLLVTRWRRAAVRCLCIATVLLLLAGYTPAGSVLLLMLTERFPAWQGGGNDPTGIIVLGGAISPDESVARNAVEMNGAAERIFAMIELARRFPNARIVFTGGSANMIADAVSEAPIAADVLTRSGVARERITLEAQSRTTDENATMTRALVSPKPGERWLLVTSAFHMPRSMGAFRAAGFDVEAYPVDWRTRGWVDVAIPFGSLSDGLVRSDLAFHEWTGLFSYWMTGRSKSFFRRHDGALKKDARAAARTAMIAGRAAL